MKMLEVGSIMILLILTACSIAGVICAQFLGPNNPIEQVVEEIIQEEIAAYADASQETNSSNKSEQKQQGQIK